MPKEPMTEGQIAEIRGREKAATQGPWGLDYKKLYVFSADDVNVCEVRGWGELSHKHGFDKDAILREMQKNAVFIARSREDIPALLDEVERLRKRQAWLIKHVVQIGGFICPMPENYECEYHVGVLCCFDSLEKRERCWEMALRHAMEQKKG